MATARTEDTINTGDAYARARTQQTALGVVVCALGLVAAYMKQYELALLLVGIGAKLMPTGTFMAPKL